MAWTLVQRVFRASRCRNERIAAAAAWDTWNARIAAAAGDTRSPHAVLRHSKIITGAYKTSRQGPNARIAAAATRQWISPQAVGMRLLPTTTSLMEKLQRRILHSPLEVKLMVKHAQHLLKLAHIKMRLEQTRKFQISYSDFIYICSKDCSTLEEILELAILMEESGSVMVFYRMVLLGDQEVKLTVWIQKQIIELENLEKKKSIIDEKAFALVRREVWFVFLALVVGRALGALPSWKSLLFFTYSFHQMGKIIFFLRTKKEPTLRAFFESRVEMKQQQLMRLQEFDIKRYQMLKDLKANMNAVRNKHE